MALVILLTVSLIRVTSNTFFFQSGLKIMSRASAIACFAPSDTLKTP